MEFHSFLTFFLNFYHSFCRCISFQFRLSSPGSQRPFLPLLVANTELPAKQEEKVVGGAVDSGGGAHLSHSASGLSPILQYVYSPTFKLLPDYSHLNHLERLCKIILWVEKKISFQFGVEISIKC